MAIHLRSPIAAVFATASLLAAACGADDSSRPEGLRDIRDTAPVEDADATESSATELDEPVPGVFIPAGALEVDDDLDLPTDRQLEYLQFALDAYLYTTSALNTGVWDEAELARYYAETELERSVDGFQRYEERGLRQVNDGTTLEFIRIGSVTPDTVVLHRCIAHGTADGVIDVATGEYLFEAEQNHWLSAVELRRLPVDDDVDAPRIVGGGGEPDVACP